jgi:oxygen-independent coproporphyrinogen III oxidase
MNQPSPRRYIASLERGERAVTNTEEISERTAMGETMMLGLRLLEDGVSEQSFARRHHVSLFAQFEPQIAQLTSTGLLEANDHGVRLSRRGALLANAVCVEFL